jgi:hypothetical protein
MAGLDGVNPELARRFLALQGAARAAGFNLGISSGFRSPEQQQALRRAHCCNDPGSSKCGCGPPTAPPGRSNHQHGLAIDLSGNKAAKAWANAHGAQFGLHFPVAGEDWHVEMIGSDGHYHGAQQMGAIGLDVNWLEAQESPEEREDRLIGGFFDAMTGAMNDELLASPQATPELSSPAMAEVGSPDLSAGGGTGTEPAPDIRLETLQQGQPGMTGQPAGGGQWQGGLPPPGFVPPGQGVERWRGIMEAAMRYAGVEPTPALVALGLRRLGQESGGDPRAVNNWDINAKRGDPSKGLMQNIGSAFPDRAKELTSRGIYDGFANIVASIRYTLNRYGSLEKGWGRPGGY